MTATVAPPVLLLMTKLFVPGVRRDLVVRPRVVQRLEAGLGGKLTLVSAPPGFGKTSLISNWCVASRENISIAWLSLDERDNDPHRFLTYVTEALHLANSAIDGDARMVLRTTPNVQPEIIVTRLINSIGQLAERIVLVLDDYHVIENPAIHEAMDYLIARQPPQLHIILTGRAAPPLSLARLRGRGEVTDIRAEELRFSVEETETFLRGVLGRDIGPDGVLELEQRTEGWVTGLQLAAISMRDRDDIEAFISSFSGHNRHIVDYLVDEVLDRQSSDIHDFLLRTSLFDRFNADLCDAVTGRRDSEAALDHIERSNLFIISLDSERRWFRYHHLFADLLRRRLRQAQPDLIPELRHRASVWFEEHGEPVEAAWQSIAGEDWQRAAGLIEIYKDSLYAQGQSKIILRLTQAMPEDVVRARPSLLETRAWAHILNGQADRSYRDLATLHALLDEIDGDPARPDAPSELGMRRLRGSLAAARSMNSILDNDFSATLELGAEALRYLVDDDDEQRSMVKAMRAQGFWLLGDLEASWESAREALALTERTDAPLFKIISLLTLGSIEVEWGRLARAADYYRRAFDYAESRGLSTWQYIGRVLSFQSEIDYERNDLDAALESARRGRDIVDYWSVSHAYDVSYPQLGRMLYVRGDLDGAGDVLRRAPAYSGLGPGASEVAQIRAFQALIDLETGRQPDLTAVEAVMGMPESEAPGDVWLWMPARRTWAQVLNGSGRHEEAVALLEPLVEFAAARGWERQMAASGSVLALGYFGLGDRESALRTLDQVLTRAEGHGFLRSVIDAGPGIDQLIDAVRQRLHTKGRRMGYVDRLHALAVERYREPRATTAPSAQGLVEPLTERELEVLGLIAAGYTNAEAADRLFVVVGTVKAHAHNIYGKLGVRSRTQAVARARELGLIE